MFMIQIKTESEIAVMAEGGRKLGSILTHLSDIASVGVTLNHIEQEAQKLIKESGGTPSFQTVSGYRWATCLCVNDVVVHGVPSEYVPKDGDILTIDIGMLYGGFHTDTAWTKIIGNRESGIGKETKKYDSCRSVKRRLLKQSVQPEPEAELGIFQVLFNRLSNHQGIASSGRSLDTASAESFMKIRRYPGL